MKKPTRSLTLAHSTGIPAQRGAGTRARSGAVALALGGLVLAPLAAAQEAEVPRRPSAADEQRPPTFVRLAAGTTERVANELDQVLGHAHDHVVERATGRVSHVILQTPARDGGVHRYVVPFERFLWNARERRLVLPISPERLATMPEFDAEELGLAARAVDTAAEGAEGATQPPPNVLASALADVRVVAAEDAPFGTVTGLVLEPRHGVVAFVLVAPTVGKAGADSDPYVVPYPALEPTEAGDLGIDAPAVDLADAPRLPAEEGVSALERRRLLEAVRRFYGVRAPAAWDAIGRKD